MSREMKHFLTKGAEGGASKNSDIDQKEWAENIATAH